MSEIKQVLNSIAGKDRFFGLFSEQIHDSYTNSNFLLSFIGISSLMEQCVKFSADMLDGEFHQALKKIHDEGLITNDEFETVSVLKRNRNNLFHENIHMLFFVIDNINYPVDENETFELLLKDNMLSYLKIIEKIL